MPIAFEEVGVFAGAEGGPNVLSFPTSLQFGPDGRLYVSEQNGSINAFEVAFQNGNWVATSHELLVDGNGNEIVKSIQNHNDDGSLDSSSNRQVTGVLTAGTADEPILYITSSDPRIATNGDIGLDTNSGVLTRASWNATTEEWDVVDLVRGLPRSEENHSVNGMVLTEGGDKLLLQVGGNTNNGAPSGFFSYTNEYALSGAILEIDLVALDALPSTPDSDAGQGGTTRLVKYDLPTLDDPNIENVTDGVGEDEFGMDEDGPFGGNDGLNMAILPADAPIKIFADGFRNGYDLAIGPDGKIYSVDNGSNGGLGGAPATEGGDLDGDGIANEAIATPSGGSFGEGEPLVEVVEGGYYYHANPVRSNQNQSWTVYNDSGDEDTSLDVSSVSDISSLVPEGVNIPDGFLIDPSRFAGLEGLDPNDPADLQIINDRLFLSGITIDSDNLEQNDPDGNGPGQQVIEILGSSTNGIIVYDSQGQAFDGSIDGAIFVTQFNDNVTLLKVNADGTALEPVLQEGPDGIYGTSDDTVQDPDGVLFVANNSLGVPLTNPLDITQGPDGTLWVAEIGGSEITVLAPTDFVAGPDTDADNDGIENAVDPFIRDASNGTTVTITPGTPTIWEFSQGADSTTPGPDGFGGGLTGVMINGSTDFEAFFQAPRNPGDPNDSTINLDNVKFVTAAGGGTTVIEEVSEGDPFQGANTGEFLFHTGFVLAENVDTFTITWVVKNPGAVAGGSDITKNFQQIGGYIGDGTQSNYLKIVAIETSDGASAPNIQIALENGDAISQTINLPATGIFDNAALEPDSNIVFELEIDPTNATATPKATYTTTTGDVELTGPAVIDLTGSAVLDTILGNNQVEGQQTGIAAGLFSSNTLSPNDTFQAVFDSITVTASEAQVGPDAQPDAFFTPLDEPIIIPVGDLLQNDTDANPGDTLAVTGVSNSTNGTAVLSDNGTATTEDDFVTFTPNAGFEGAASFTYTLSDGTDTDTADVTISVAGVNVLFRVNAGPTTIQALPNDPFGSDLDWIGTGAAGAQTGTQSGLDFSVNVGNIGTFGVTSLDPSVPDYVPQALYNNERWDPGAAPEMVYSFGGGVLASGVYTVNLYAANGFGGTSAPGTRIFDVEIEGEEVFTDIDLSNQFGHQVGGILSWTGEVTDGTLDIEWLHDVENPLVNGIEILSGALAPAPLTVSIVSGDAVSVDEGDGTIQVSLLTNRTVPADETVDITFEIQGVTATVGAGGDFQYNGGGTFGGGTYIDTVSIAGSSSDVTIPIEILQDADIEPGEAFTFKIVGLSSNATLGAVTEATITIEDDDTPLLAGDVVYRINAGGPQVAATDGGPDWQADQGDVVNGSAVAGPASPFLVDRGLDGTTTGTSDNATYGFVGGGDALVGTNATGAPDALFATERFSVQENPDNIGYAFDVENRSYTVNLFFDELFFSAAGARLFDVEIEGTQVLDDFDTFVEAGNSNDTVVQSFEVEVEDGELNIELLKTATNNPHIAAIEIIAGDDPVAADTVDGTPVPGNDLSSDAAAPTAVALAADGSTTVVSNLEGGHNDRDFFTVSIPEGSRLVDVILEDYSADLGNSGFIGLKLGADFVTDPAIPALGITPDGVVEPGDLDGGFVFNDGQIGQDLLPLMNNTGAGFAGFNETGLTGDVTLWLNQGGDPSQATLTFVTEPIPAEPTVLFRVNAGGVEVAATDDGPAWSADTAADASEFLTNPGSGNTFPASPNLGVDNTLVPNVPVAVLGVERWDNTNDANGEMAWSFPVEAGRVVEVRVYVAELFAGLPDLDSSGDPTGDRVFDISVNGDVPPSFENVDPYVVGGNAFNSGGVVTTRLVSDGAIDLEFIHNSENTAVKAIEIVDITDLALDAIVSIASNGDVVEQGDIGSTNVEFAVDFDIPPAAPVTVAYDVSIGGVFVETLSQVIPVEGGALSVAVANDAVDNGAEEVTITLTEILDGPAVLGETDATALVNEDENPLDIDGDGILNTDDPFAFDGTNGDAKVIVGGVEFVQDFNTDTTDPFSAEAGFTGILVNQGFDPAGTSAEDPYGDRTTESGVSISGGTLSVLSSETDVFGSGATGANNNVKDNYQSAADVTGTNLFEVEARTANPFFDAAGDGSAPALTAFASWGITLGAGGTDDYVKLVLGGAGSGPRVQIANEGSLTGVKEENISTGALVDIADAKDVVFRLEVDTVAATVQGFATFLDANDSEITTISTSLRSIDPAGSLAAAIDGVNPLTGGDGGVAYGISITDWGGAPSFTGVWDYLKIASLDDDVTNDAPSVTLQNTIVSLAENSDTVAGLKVADIVVSDDALGTNDLSLSGEDAALFQIQMGPLGPELWIAPNAALNFEATPALNVQVDVDDTTVGTTPDASAALTIDLSDENDAPTITGSVTPGAIVTGIGGTIDLSNILVDDEDLGDSATLMARTLGETTLPTGFVLNGTVLEIDGTVPVSENIIELYAVDASGEESVLNIEFQVDVTAAPEVETVLIQAEDLTKDLNFFDQNAAASDGGVIRVNQGEEGLASIGLDGLVAPGTYFMIIKYFDENDGESVANVSIGDFTESWTLNEPTNGNAAGSQTYRERTTDTFEVAPGDTLSLQVFADGEEFARFDAFELVPVQTDGFNLPPFSPNGVEDQMTQAGTVFTLDLAQFVFDPEEDALSFQKVSGPDWVSINAEGFVTGVPAPGDVGAGEVVVSISDGSNGPIQVSFSIDVADTPVDNRMDVKIEAEDFTSAEFFEENQSAASGTSGGKVFRLAPGDSGTATYVFDDTIEPGLYEIAVTHFDENDGESQVTVLSAPPGGAFTEVGSWILDNDGGQNAGQAQNLRTVTVGPINVEPGATLQIAGVTEGDEFVRLDFVTLRPFIGNLPPEIDTIDPLEVTALAEFQIDLSAFASDPDEDSLSFSLLSAPDFVSISDDGILSGTASDVGTFDVTVAVTDGANGSGQTAVTTFQIVANQGDVAPVIETDMLSVVENQTLIGQIIASDVNLDDITLSIANTGADDALFTITPEGEISFVAAPDFETPGDADQDNVYSVDIAATSNGLTTTKTVTIDVTDINEAATETAPLGEQSATVGETVMLPDLSTLFEDPDGDALLLTALGLPEGVTLEGTSFIGAPLEVGTFPVTIQAFDGEFTSVSEFDLVVAPDGPAATTAAYISVNAGATNLDTTSTFSGESFLVRNDSTNGELITEFQIDLDASIIPFVGFDVTSDGDGGIDYGDSLNKDFVVDAGTTPGVSVTNVSFARPTDTVFPGSQKEGGTVTMTVTLEGFAPGAALTFSLDQDPPSIKNGSPSSAANAGAIAGVEQVGSLITFTFDDGSVRTVDLFSDGSPAGAEAYADADLLDAPIVSILGVDTAEAEVTEATQTVTISGGPANGQAKILILEGGAFRVTNDSPDNGYLFEEFETNKALVNQEILVTLDANGSYTGEITLTDTPLSGTQASENNVNYVVAAFVDNKDADGNLEVSSRVSDKVSLKLISPPAADEIQAIFDAQTDVVQDATYAPSAVGAAVLTINAGDNTIDTSNFGANSFQVENTGDKKISAVFIDTRSALYDDSVFDPDGQGGDNVAKPWAVNDNDIDGNGNSAGGFVTGSGYFFPGDAPLPNTTGTGTTSNGGFKGALVKFNANVDGGFDPGDAVGFSGDMDPNSIAGLNKGGASGVDPGAIQSWDVGGVGGGELLGSVFYVLYDDGTTSTGYLASDGSDMGAQALSSQAVTPEIVSLSVNGVAPGDTGTYGVTQPTVIVTGDPGQDVRITLSKGFNPVTNTTNGVADLVAARLEDAAFGANNAFDVQTVDVTIGSDGTFDASALFDYVNTPANEKGSFNGDDVADIAFIAVAIDPQNGDLPIGPTTAPIYLGNEGGPVEDGSAGTDGFFQIIGSGNSARFKVQVEDPAIQNGGTTPGGDWTYVPGDGADGNQSGTQGSGHYYWGSEASSTALNPPEEAGFLEYTIFIPEGEGGTYSFRIRSSRDTGDPGDARNDIWLKIDDDAEALQVDDTNSVSNNGFVKIFGGGTGGWGFASQIDSASDEDPNFSAEFDLEPGLHTITLAGRSEGFHIDFFELYKGGAPGVNASNSVFVPSGDTAPFVANPIADVTLDTGSGSTLPVPANTFVDLDGDTLTVSASIPGNAQSFVSFNSATNAFTVAPSAPVGTYTLSVTAEDDDGNTATDSFDLTVQDAPDGPVLDFVVFNGSTEIDGDLNVGDTLALSDLGATPLFSGTLSEGSIGSVFLELIDDNGNVVDSKTENASPYDLPYDGPSLNVGDYILQATFYENSGLGGDVLGTQSVAFSITGDSTGGPDSFRLEAESMSLEAGFAVFNEGGVTNIRLPSNDPNGPDAIATTSLDSIAPGNYIVQVLAYDENDGAGSFQLTVGNDQFDFVELDGSQGGSVGGSSQAGNRVLFELGEIEIAQGDNVELVYQPGGNEVGRFDFIDFIAVDELA